MVQTSDRVVIGILAAPGSRYAEDLSRAAKLAGSRVEVQLLRFGELQATIASRPDASMTLHVGERPAGGSPSDMTGGSGDWRERAGGAEAGALDALIVRSMPLGTLEQVIFRMDCLQAWESRGTVVVNSPRCLETAIDKWLTLHRLAESGVLVPATVACQTRASAMKAFQCLGRDVLVKPLFGGEGRGIVRLQDEDVAWRVFGSLQAVGQVLYVQQFIAHAGYDIRVLLIGDNVYSIKRRAAAAEWRTNLALGSCAESHRLSDQELELARRAARAVDGSDSGNTKSDRLLPGRSILGVDILPGRDGRLYVLEVNAVPGWLGLAKALNVDVARVVIEHIICQVQG